jgi:hypothetical protein
MNCISGSILACCLVAFSACGAPLSESGSDTTYAVHYSIALNPNKQTALVSLHLVQSRGQLRELSFSSAAIEPSSVSASGSLTIDEDRIVWRPDAGGGDLKWQISVPHRRGPNGFDAWLAAEWGIFRAEDIIPRARTRTLKSAKGVTSFSFVLPPGWSVVTEYKNESGRFSVDNPKRRFDQPTGWITTGHLGVRRESIAGIRVAIAAPEGQSVRRMDMLALLNWTLPELATILDAPPRLTIVSAAEPMWRGGLSAPASIYLHADRPLISENATSALLHEVMHVTLRIRTKPGYDWIAEGLAEYYSLDLLQRGGAITARRYKAALLEQSEWAKKAGNLCAAASRGATTALAVTVLRNLDHEIRATTDGKKGLDDLTARLANSEFNIDIASLRKIAASLMGKPSDALHIGRLPGCRRIATTTQA